METPVKNIISCDGLYTGGIPGIETSYMVPDRILMNRSGLGARYVLSAYYKFYMHIYVLYSVLHPEEYEFILLRLHLYLGRTKKSYLVS